MFILLLIVGGAEILVAQGTLWRGDLGYRERGKAKYF